MDRRNFFKIVSATSAGAVSTGCGTKVDNLIPLLVPEHEIVPGEEQWHPAVCTECSAGCGTIVRIMEGIRNVERNGERLRERIACVKKIEGNPLDPVSGGRLCARGQAAVQALYHPDRLRGPMKRTGERGAGKFTPVSWEEAIASAADKLAKVRASDPGGIVFLTGPNIGSRSLSIRRFAEALGARPPAVCSIAGFPLEQKAAEQVFGWKGLPVYDLAQARFVLSVGADFLGGWASPVFYSRQFGHFRQGRSEVRGHLVHAESRLSLTAAAADEWLPLRPGTEAQFLGAVGRLLVDAGRVRNTDAVETFRSIDVVAMLAACGLNEARVREVVRRLGESEAPLVIAGASAVHTNSLDSVSAGYYLNLLLGNVGKPGGVLAPAGEIYGNYHAMDVLSRARVILVDGANPVYTLPRSSGVQDAFTRAEMVIDFGSFLDDSAGWSDLLLPGHHALESEAANIPAVSVQTAVAVAAPFVQPLYNTAPVEQTLANIAKKMGLDYRAVTAKEMLEPLLPDGASYDDVVRHGGLWVENKSTSVPRVKAAKVALKEASFAGDPSQYPLLLQPYLSLQFQDGQGSHLPWLQELPDPASSSIWGLPVEIDPGTAAQLKIVNGDVVRVETPHGAIEAPAYVHPGAIPRVISMAIGDGHTHYGRYASGRGVNPLSILAPVWEESTGALAVGGTRARVKRVGGPRDWIQFATPDRHARDAGHR